MGNGAMSQPAAACADAPDWHRTDVPTLGGAWSMIACMAAAGRIARLWIDAEQRVLERLDRLRVRIGRQPELAPHLATGLDGERAAYFELRRRGYRMVARRWTSTLSRGDVDLIGWDGRRLCFIEVKTRTKRDNYPAESAVDEDKCDMLRGLGRIYLRAFPESQRSALAVRFDVVSVYSTGAVNEFQVLQDAFAWY